MLLLMHMFCSVLRPSEAVRYAPQAPTRLYLPAPRPTEEGSPVHCHPAHVPGAALGHQDITRRYRFPHDGEFTNTFPPISPLNVNNIDSLFLCLQVLALVFVRKVLDLCFSNRELSYLDDLMPEWKKKNLDDASKQIEEVV